MPVGIDPRLSKRVDPAVKLLPALQFDEVDPDSTGFKTILHSMGDYVLAYLTACMYLTKTRFKCTNSKTYQGDNKNVMARIVLDCHVAKTSSGVKTEAWEGT